MASNGKRDEDVLTAETLVEQMVFNEDYSVINRMEKSLMDSIRKHKMLMFSMIGLVAVTIIMFLIVFSLVFTDGSKFFVVIVVAIFLGVGTAIQLGTLLYGIFSRTQQERTEKITELLRQARNLNKDLDRLVNRIIRREQFKCADELLYENNRNIMDRSDWMTMDQLKIILTMLAKNKSIKAGKRQMTLYKLDRSIEDFNRTFDDYLLKFVFRTSVSDGGEKTLLYLKKEFTPQTVKELTKDNPLLKKVNLSSLQVVQDKVKAEMNKKGISYSDLSEESDFYELSMAIHEQKKLSKKIRASEKHISKTQGNIDASIEDFVGYQKVLDTKIAVLMLAVAGVVAALIDILY